MRNTLWLVGLAYLYLTCLLCWALLYTLFSDRWGWLFLMNSFALYFFLPLPILLLIAKLTNQPRVLIGAVIALVLWCYLYSWMFVPRNAKSHAHGTEVTVMTSNLLGYNQYPEQTIAALRASDADVIGLQELNPIIAAAIQQALTGKYPYQWLDPHSGDAGMGVISRYPLRSLDVKLPGIWSGSPQVLLFDVRGVSILFLNVHAIPPRFSNMEGTIRERERQAMTIAGFVASRPEPAIVVGDFNAVDLSRAYRTMSKALHDAWHEVGWGLGHTFPGADSPGSSRRIIHGILAPMWLVRIDYVFYSEDWRAEWARIGPWDGVSDHRPVQARLVLRVR